MKKVILGKKYLIGTRPREENDWGYCQFPTLTKYAGKVYVRYADAPDSVRSFGNPGIRAVYNEEKDAFEPFPSDDNSVMFDSGASSGTVHFPDGSMLFSFSPRGRDIKDIKLPEKRWANFPWYIDCAFDAQDIRPLEDRWWHFMRSKGPGQEWVLEKPEVFIPGEMRLQREGLLFYPCFRHMLRLSDGTLLGAKMTLRLINGKPCHYARILILASTDEGKTWKMRSEVPYMPDTRSDAHWETALGFNEPYLQETKDGSVILLIRTQERHPAPMYFCHSSDKANTWTFPEKFSDHGVKPRMTRVGDDILLVYGRPGVSIRLSEDAHGMKWGEEIQVIKPTEGLFSDSCGYVYPIALDEKSAMIAYSDFKHVDENGAACKAIYVQRVEIVNE